MFVMLLGSFTYAQITDGDYTFEFGGCELTHAEKFINYTNAMASTENSKDEFEVIYAADFRVDELPPFILAKANATTDKSLRNQLLRGGDVSVEDGNHGIGRTTATSGYIYADGIFRNAKNATLYIISEGGLDPTSPSTFFYGPSTVRLWFEVTDFSTDNTTQEQFRDFYLKVIQAKWDLLHP